METFLIRLKTGSGYCKDDKVEKFDYERDVIHKIAEIAAGPQLPFDDDPTELISVHKIDIDKSKIVKLVPVMENLRIVLKESEENG